MLFEEEGSQVGGRDEKEKVGSRNDSSVLFTLRNLPELAVQKDKKCTSASVVRRRMEEDLSGLDDIQALARTVQSGDDTGILDVMALGAAGNEALLTPNKNMKALSKKRKIIVLSVSAVLVIGLVFAVVFTAAQMIAPSSDEKYENIKTQIAALHMQLAVLREQKQSEAAASVEGKDQPRASSKVAKVMTSGDMGRVDSGNIKAKPQASASQRKPKSKVSSNISRAGFLSKKEKPARKPQSSEKIEKINKELDMLLGGSSNKGPRSGSGLDNKARSRGSKGVHKSLNRSDVQKGMKEVAHKVKRCGKGKDGLIRLKVVIGKNGNTKNVAVAGKYAGTRLGTCVAKAVRKAEFPASKKDMTVSYPFRL